MGQFRTLLLLAILLLVLATAEPGSSSTRRPRRDPDGLPDRRNPTVPYTDTHGDEASLSPRKVIPARAPLLN